MYSIIILAKFFLLKKLNVRSKLSADFTLFLIGISEDKSIFGRYQFVKTLTKLKSKYADSDDGRSQLVDALLSEEQKYNHRYQLSSHRIFCGGLKGFDHANFSEPPLRNCFDFDLFKRPVFNDNEAFVDIVIPVYGQYNDTLNCIYSVLRSSNKKNYEIIVIDDGSPDRDLSHRLRQLSHRGLITLISNKNNLGFVRSANIGMKLHVDRDVLLLNSDTIVFGDFLDRLRFSASSVDDVGTITPLSNNATICSYPVFCRNYDKVYDVQDCQLDQIVSEVNQGLLVKVPTGVGFCLYITRQCINSVGYFDAESFDKGYGEENDFCIRAKSSGFINYAAGDVFVRHFGGRSFKGDALRYREENSKKLNKKHPNYAGAVDTFIRDDPMRSLRFRADVGILYYRIKQSFDNIIILISHTRGGGLEKCVQESKLELERHPRTCVLLMRLDGSGLFIVDSPFYSSVMIRPLSLVNEFDLILSFFEVIRPDLLHIHSLVDASSDDLSNFSNLLLNASFPYFCTLHDFSAICPRVHLLTRHLDACGDQSLSACYACLSWKNDTNIGRGDVESYRDRYSSILRHAQKVFVPSRFTAQLIDQSIKLNNIVLLPHEEISIASRSSIARSVEKVLILGAISPVKGSEVWLRLLTHCEKKEIDLDFLLLGKFFRGWRFRHFGRLHVHGTYRDSEVSDLIEEYSPDIALFLNQSGETFGYTLSHVLSAGIHPVVTDIGSLPDRIRDLSIGTVLKDSEDVRSIVDEILSIRRLDKYTVKRISAINFNSMYS